jgi:hypothetical protein
VFVFGVPLSRISTRDDFAGRRLCRLAYEEPTLGKQNVCFGTLNLTSHEV